MNAQNANSMVGFLALGSLVGILVFGSLSFFVMPLYASGVDLGLKAMIEVFTFSAGAKAGLAVAGSNKQ